MNLAVFNELENKLNDLPLESIVERAAFEQESLMEDLNVQQMEEGIRSDGSLITPEYKPATIAIKKKKGQRFDKVTLKDTGQFHSQVRVKRYPRKQELVSYDWKSEQLQEKYNPEILGLTDENLQVVRDNMKPTIIEEVRKHF